MGKNLTRLRHQIAVVPKRNWTLYGIAGLFLLLAFLSWPTDRFDIFTPRPTAMFPFTLVTDVMADSEVVSNSMLVDGVVCLTGKGGVSADNALTVNITLYFNVTTHGKQPSSIGIKLPGAFAEPPGIGPLGIPHWVEILLTRDGDIWQSVGLRIRYTQGGAEPIIVKIDNQDYESAQTVQIGSGDVTITTRTNSLLVSLTWVILFFSTLEFRVRDYGNQHEKEH